MVAPVPSEAPERIADPEETSGAVTVEEPEPIVEDPQPVVFTPPVSEPLAPDAVVDSAPWFTVLGYAGGSGFDGPLLDVSNDGSLWLVGDGDQRSVLFASETREAARLPGVSASAKLSGDGEYVVYGSGEECATSERPCDAANDERRMLQLATGEVQDLGGVRGPILVDVSGRVVVGLVGNPEGSAVKESIEWADGSTTAVRLLFGELGDLPPSWFQAPQLFAMDGSGDVVVYGPWIEDDITREAFFSVLTPLGVDHLVGDEAFGTPTLPEADIATAGDVFVFATTTGMTSVLTSDGSRRHYIVDDFDRIVAAFRLAGNTAIAMITPGRQADGPVEVIEFGLGASVFEQSGDVLFRIPDPALPQTVGRGGLKLQASADGTTLGVSVLIEDLDHPNEQSWLNIIVDLDARPPGSIIEVTAQGVVGEATDQQFPAQTDPEVASHLSGYLAALAELGADVVAYQDVLNNSGGGLADFSELWRGASTELASFDPPPEARALDEGWRSLATEFADAFDGLAAVSDSTDPVETQQALDAFLLATADLGVRATSLDEVQLKLTLDVLEGRDDPMKNYLVQILDLQQDAEPIIERMLSALTDVVTDPVVAVESIVTAVDDMRQFADEWALIQAPDGAVGLHRARRRLFSDFASVFDDLADAVETNTEPSNSLVRRLDNLSIDSQQLNAAMSRLTAEVLRNAG